MSTENTEMTGAGEKLAGLFKAMRDAEPDHLFEGEQMQMELPPDEDVENAVEGLTDEEVDEFVAALGDDPEPESGMAADEEGDGSVPDDDEALMAHFAAKEAEAEADEEALEEPAPLPEMTAADYFSGDNSASLGDFIASRMAAKASPKPQQDILEKVQHRAEQHADEQQADGRAVKVTPGLLALGAAGIAGLIGGAGKGVSAGANVALKAFNEISFKSAERKLGESVNAFEQKLGDFMREFDFDSSLPLEQRQKNIAQQIKESGREAVTSELLRDLSNMETASRRVADRGVKAGMDADQVANSALRPLDEVAKRHQKLLESIKDDQDKSLFANLQERVSGIFDALAKLFERLMEKVGLGTSKKAGPSLG